MRSEHCAAGGSPVAMDRPEDYTYLIVNADDFGQTQGINTGIVAAMDRGIVTSASLMVRWPAAAEAARLALQRPHVSLGLHIDLGEWVYRNGDWQTLYEVVPPNDAGAAAAEVYHQLEAFRALTGTDPTHIDSHQHVHRDEPLRGVVLELSDRLGVPIRHFDGVVRHCGAYYGQTASGESVPEWISHEHLLRILRNLPAGVTELGCHPGITTGLESMYLWEREAELAVLCDPQLRIAISDLGIELCSFRDVTPPGARATR